MDASRLHERSHRHDPNRHGTATSTATITSQAVNPSGRTVSLMIVPAATGPALSSTYHFVYTHSMDIASITKRARAAADLTQAELARRAGTAQSAVAAYESGRRTPGVRTLERLLDACDHDLMLAARPRARRGALSLDELAPLIAEDLADGRERDALRLLFGFADDFRGSSRPGMIELIREEPRTTGDPRFDAALAGVAELFSIEAQIPTPAWVNEPSRFVEPWWFATSREAFEAYTLARTPAALARHGVFIAREVFDRA